MPSIFNFFLKRRDELNPLTTFTFKPLRDTSISTSSLTNKGDSLLSPNSLLRSIQLPTGIAVEEWLTYSANEFFNDSSLIWGSVVASIENDNNDNNNNNKINDDDLGFPKGFEYRWREKSKTVRCNASEYINHVMNFLEEELDELPNGSNNDNITGITTNYPKNFMNRMYNIFKKLLRVYNIVLTNHRASLKKMDLETVVDTSFKHFTYLCLEFELIKDQREFLPLKKIVDNHSESYKIEKTDSKGFK